MKREINLEKFYTKIDTVKYCISKIDLKNYDTIIEPSAGNGSFSNLLNCVAFDIEPENNNIIKADFLKLSIEKKEKILVIGNPPFGRQSNLAIKFINHAATFADTIAFVLPLSFKKESMIKKLNNHLHLTNVYDLSKNAFYYANKDFDIPCAFFIFKYKKELREKFKKYQTEDFKFVNKEKADYSIRRVGYYAGKIENLNVSKESHYFIKDYNNALNILRKLKYQSALDTVGARSISKNEIVKEYLKQKDLIN